ncbi:MAG: hypothetical protein BWY82_02983 [Verrucomicrobia bacterium ADurb.Bin474]|nr:MAG: hypothetical protein BWY82_02983 [Verrucomicrobia bacterium ADurb.Bin474]
MAMHLPQSSFKTCRVHHRNHTPAAKHGLVDNEHERAWNIRRIHPHHSPEYSSHGIGIHQAHCLGYQYLCPLPIHSNLVDRTPIELLRAILLSHRTLCPHPAEDGAHILHSWIQNTRVIRVMYIVTQRLHGDVAAFFESGIVIKVSLLMGQ